MNNERNEHFAKAVKSIKIREFFLIKFSVFFFFINIAYICEKFHTKPNKNDKTMKMIKKFKEAYGIIHISWRDVVEGLFVGVFAIVFVIVVSIFA